MKKINSIHYGFKILLTGIIVMVLIPILLSIINIRLRLKFISIATWIIFGAGSIIVVGFIIVLIIELHQDRKIDIYYSTHKNIKIKLENGKYECTACGNRNVQKDDTICNVCGIKFSEEEGKSVNEILK